MKLNRALILLILTLSIFAGVSAQESTWVFPLHFRMGSAAIDSTYKDNSLQLKRVMQFAQKVSSDRNIVLSKVTFCGSASPEAIISSIAVSPMSVSGLSSMWFAL